MAEDSDYDTFVRRTYFAPLDGLRAIAALAVFFAHVYPTTLFHWLDGSRGVRWFFALSGFLITTLSLREEDRRSAVHIRGFVVRRAFRILPLYYLALIAALVADLLVLGGASGSTAWREYWPWYLTMNADVPAAMGWTNTPFKVAWSLGVEEKFYVIWPLVGFVFLAHRWRGRVGFMVASFASIAVLDVVADGTPLAVFVRPFQPIVAGCIAALLMHQRDYFRSLSATSKTIPALLLAIAVVVPWERVGLGQWPGFRSVYSVLIALAIVALAASENPVSRLLSASMLVWLGLRTYAFYLFHGLIIRATSKPLDHFGVSGFARTVLLVSIALPLTIVVAHLLFTRFERPLSLRGRELSRLGRRGIVTARD